MRENKILSGYKGIKFKTNQMVSPETKLSACRQNLTYIVVFGELRFGTNDFTAKKSLRSIQRNEFNVACSTLENVAGSTLGYTVRQLNSKL